MAREVLSVRIGVAGSGKTLSVVQYVCTEFLPFEAGRVISNLPFKPEAIGARLAGTRGVGGKPMTAEEIAARFEVIPKDVLDAWAAEESGPWEYFAGASLAGAVIFIDEAHNYVGSKHQAKHRRAWMNWIGELRHLGATIELVTQAEQKLAKEFKEEAGAQIYVVSSESRRDPVFGIQLGDVYQLLAKLWPSRGYRAATWVEERRNAGGRKFVTEKTTKFVRDPFWFELYDSYSTPAGGGVSGRLPLQYETLAWPAFLKWLFVRNAWNVVTSRGFGMLLLAFLLGWEPSRSWVKSQYDAVVASAMVKAGGKGITRQSSGGPVRPTLAPGGQVLVDANRASQAIGDAESGVVRSKALTEDKRDKVIAELRAAKERLELAQEEYAREMAAQRECVGVVGDDFLFRNGERYAIDEPIRDGPLAGLSIKSYDKRRCELVLSDGRHIKLMRSSEPGPADPEAPVGGPRLPRPGTGFPQAVRRSAVRPAVQDPGGGRAAGNDRSVRRTSPVGPFLGGGEVDGVRGGGSGPLVAPGGAEAP